MKTVAIACLAIVLVAAMPMRAADPSTSTASSLDSISRQFWNGVADRDCGKAPRRWRLHYGDIPRRLRSHREAQLHRHFEQALRVFDGAGLPSEFALIPFIESRYRPNARSAGGQVGLWQFTAATARRNGLSVSPGHDQRLDADASTRAAARYLQRLYRMFDGDWRWTVMAYNAGEGAARAAQRKGSANTLPAVTRHYPEKLHALACLVPHPPDPGRASG